jgi:hypothetical protein
MHARRGVRSLGDTGFLGKINPNFMNSLAKLFAFDWISIEHKPLFQVVKSNLTLTYYVPVLDHTMLPSRCISHLNHCPGLCGSMILRPQNNLSSVEHP